MQNTFPKALVALVAAVIALAAVPAAAQGRIGTLERGQYMCELPGDAVGRAGIEQAEENFAVVNASRYRARDGSGTYLRRGNVLEMTSGTRNGARYQIISESFLRKMDGDTPGRLRCVRRMKSVGPSRR